MSPKMYADQKMTPVADLKRNLVEQELIFAYRYNIDDVEIMSDYEVRRELVMRRHVGKD